MKKTLLLFTIGLAALSTASAKPALFTNPTATTVRENVTCSAGTLTGKHGSLYSRMPIYNISHFRKSNAATAAIAMTIDLTAAAKVTQPTKLLTIDSTHELGLMVTPEGITGNWHGSPWGETISYGSLSTHPAAFVRNGSVYISFTVVASGCCGSGWNGIGGIMGYDVNGDLILSFPLLASAENKDFKSISANLDYVKIISVDPAVSRDNARITENAARQAAKAERKYLKTRGEWLSPTQWVGVGIFTLLILGGLSICSFRKGRW